MRKGCSTLERTDAFLDSMPFSAESVQSRPFMVEGFLATVQRIEERWGSDGDFGALRHARVAGVRIAERVVLPHEGMRHGHVGHVCGGRLHGMHEAAAGIDADMRLVSEMPVLALLGLVRLGIGVRGPCSSWSSAPR